jgi:pyruvate dehydrogenase E2 component (dihydrolipoamide acetyltransferase)
MSAAPGSDRGWAPFTPVERAMARRMERVAAAPIATEFSFVDVSAALAEVERLRADGVPATFTAVVLAAVGRGLAEYPEVAAEVDYEQWKRRIPDSINVGVAVASERGLVVPVVRAVDNKPLNELCSELASLVRAVREGSADRTLFADGYFSITNIGTLPVHGGNPLPNLPQIAILGVSSSREVPVAVDGEVRISTQAVFTIALDHRALDGITAARFLAAVKRYVEQPSTLGASASKRAATGV